MMSKTPTSSPLINTPPLSFSLSKWLQRNEMRGGTKLETFCQERSLWDKRLRINLDHNINIDVPLRERPYDKEFLLNYERLPINAVCEKLNRSQADFCMLDCGADIGIFTALVASRSSAITQVVGFEPNSWSHSHLEHNYSLLPCQAKALNKAVSNFCGDAELVWPDFDDHDHAAFIQAAEHGPISVLTIDSLDLGTLKGLLLKADVEGEELNVIKGAKETIARASQLLLLFEVHAQQTDRVAVDPCEKIKEVADIRPCKAIITEASNRPINLDLPFFEQVEGLKRKVFNILVYSE